MRAYYNDFEPFVCAWLRNLMAAGWISKGTVDGRSILEVQPSDLTGYPRCHFFAGIGGWDYALELAEWPEERPIWTASLPCQPFSVAGKAQGVGDERHLWPAFRRLVEECRPPVLVGEQVASKDGRAWLAGVRADLEGMGYAVGAADLCAASCGAPHIRQRLFWVAESDDGHPSAEGLQRSGEHGQQPQDGGAGERLADAFGPGGGWDGRSVPRAEASSGGERRAGGRESYQPFAGRRMDDPTSARRQPEREGSEGEARNGTRLRGPQSGCWDGAVWLPCLDGKARRIESGLEPLVNGTAFRLADGRTVEGTSRTGLLRGIGNAIVAPLAAEFLRAYLEAEGGVAA